MMKVARLGALSAAAAALPLLAIAVQDPPFEPPPNIAGQSAWVPIRHQRQEFNLCVPTSASMILDYFAIPISPREIKVLSRGKIYRPDEAFADFTPMTYDELLPALRRLGYKWRLKGYAQDAAGFNNGIAEIERSLDHGLPVMIDTILGVGHTYVVAGYSSLKKSLFIVDPDSEAPGIRAVHLTDLIWIWKGGRDPRAPRWAVFSSRQTRRFAVSR